MFELVCAIIGLVLVIVGLSAPNTIALIAGIIFLALGGIILIIIRSDGDWDIF